MSRYFWLFTLALALSRPPLVSAQTDELTLSVHKQLGYNNGSEIQGTFSVEASGPPDLVSVAFFMDGQPLGTATSAPYRLEFNTEQYAMGWHTLTATGQTAGGRELTAPGKRFNFVSSAQAWQSVQGLLTPLFVAIGLAFVIGLGIQYLAVTRGGGAATLPLGAPRVYGPWGGAICSKCQRPFARHFWGLNFVTHKLDRCDHCGHWGLVARATPQQLAAAEAAELRQAQPEQPVAELTPEEKLKRKLDDSRFDAGR